MTASQAFSLLNARALRALATAPGTIPFDSCVSFNIASNMELSVYPACRNSLVNSKVQGEEQKIK